MRYFIVKLNYIQEKMTNLREEIQINFFSGRLISIHFIMRLRQQSILNIIYISWLLFDYLSR